MYEEADSFLDQLLALDTELTDIQRIMSFQSTRLGDAVDRIRALAVIARARSL